MAILEALNHVLIRKLINGGQEIAALLLLLTSCVCLCVLQNKREKYFLK